MAVPELVLGAMPSGATPQTHWAAGAWCFCGHEEDGWEERFHLAPEPLTDRNLAAVASRAAQTLAVRQIPALAEHLCPMAAQFPPVYWQVLLAPFAVEVASQVVERALRVQAMLAHWGHERLRVALLPANCGFFFADERDVTLRGSLGLDFNHWLLSRLLEGQMPKGWQPYCLDPLTVRQVPPSSRGIRSRVGEYLRSLARSLPFPMFKGLNVWDALKFSWILRKPAATAPKAPDLASDFAFDEDLARIPLPAEVGDIFIKAIPASLRQLRHRPLGGCAKAPRWRIVPTAATEQAHVRQKLARWRARGNFLGHCQHGGVYGQVATPCAATLVEYSQHVFFTWGWSGQAGARGNFQPVPSFHLSALPRYRGGDNSLIFVGTEMSAYGRRLDSHPTPLQYVAYRRAKAAFLHNLPESIRRATSYRPYFPLPGTLDDAEWLLPRFPGIGLCTGALMPQLLRCRLLVLDHPGTTMLEALAAGVPFVVWWDKAAWPWAPEAASLLRALESCGIWQESAEQAAAQVARVWSEPLDWWESGPVRDGRATFSQGQALAMENFRSAWTAKLEKL